MDETQLPTQLADNEDAEAEKRIRARAEELKRKHQEEEEDLEAEAEDGEDKAARPTLWVDDVERDIEGTMRGQEHRVCVATPHQATMNTTTTSVTLASGHISAEGMGTKQNWDAMEQDDLDAKAEEAFGLLAGVGSAERILRLLLKRLGSDADERSQQEARFREEQRQEIERLREMYDQNTQLLNDATLLQNFLMNVFNMQLRFEQNGYQVFYYMSCIVSAGDWVHVMKKYVFHGWKKGLWQLRALRLEEEKDKATKELAKTQEAHKIQSEVLSREKEKTKAMEQKAAEDLKEKRNLEGELNRTRAKAQDFESKCATAQKEAQKAKDEAAAQIEQAKKEIAETIAQSKAEIARVTDTLREEHRKKLEETTKQFEDTIAKRENDMKVMKKQINQISAELGEAIASAADLRETLKTERKAHQDLMKNASPDALAKLMGDLNALNEQLKALGMDCADQKNQKELFKRKLDQNVRRLMLERQFLPLIHGVGEFQPEQLLGTPAKDKNQEVNKKLRGGSMGNLRGPAGGGRPLTQADNRSRQMLKPLEDPPAAGDPKKFGNGKKGNGFAATH